MTTDQAAPAADEPSTGTVRLGTERTRRWAATMSGHPGDGSAGGVPVRRAHAGRPLHVGAALPRARAAREEAEDSDLAPGATRAAGAGERQRQEEPDPLRTCFERDRDRVLHSTAFRRLAGKTQVFVQPADHQRTRLTHALEVAQVATSVARACRLNVALTEAVALGHDCGHGPGGHASEDAFAPYVPGGYDHAVWGADVVLRRLNLCEQTLDGIRNHSWSRPAPQTPEAEVVSWADRVAYSAHDLEDAVDAGIVDPDQLPPEVTSRCGTTRGEQLSMFTRGLVDAVSGTGSVGLAEPLAEALAALRAFNYRHIYLRPASVRQAEAVVAVLRALVEHYADRPRALPDPPPAEAGSPQALLAAVTYVGGMTDRYAFSTASAVLGWDPAALPVGVDGWRRPPT